MSDNNLDISLDLENRKDLANNLMIKYKKEKDPELLEKAWELDNTIPDIYYEKLKANNTDNKLREKSFDILDKNKLKDFQIVKLFNHKETYFYIIDYLESIYLDESEDAQKGYEKEEFVSDSNEEDENIYNEEEDISEVEESDESEESDENEELDKKEKKIKTKKKKKAIPQNEIKMNKKEDEKIQQQIDLIDITKINDDEEFIYNDFKEFLTHKEKFDISNLLVKKETIKVKDLKKKFDVLYNRLFEFLNYKNNYPDFESEYFYYNCIRYTLETFKKLKYKKFIRKIFIMNYIWEVKNKIINGKIKNKLIKQFYYFIVNTQYDVNLDYLNKLKNYDENEIINLKNEYYIKENILFKGEKKLIVNIDNYSLKVLLSDFDDIEDKKNHAKILCFEKLYYNIKGILLNSEFNHEEGNKIWKEFLSSPVLEELQSKLFLNKDNFFKQDKIISFYQNHSLYFPNWNEDFFALSHKDIFAMYFSPRKLQENIPALSNSNILKLVLKAFAKVDIQHEWGHTSSSFLFFAPKTDYFDTPKRKLKLYKGKEIQEDENIKEGGNIVEKLLYGRIINELNIKETVYILNGENYKKTLDNFLTDFMKLKSSSVKKVFEEALKNENIDQCVKDAFKEYLNENKNFRKNIRYFSFKTKKPGFKNVDYEKAKFYCRPRRNHKSHSYYIIKARNDK